MPNFNDYELADLKIYCGCITCEKCKEDCKQTKESLVGCAEMLMEDYHE